MWRRSGILIAIFACFYFALVPASLAQDTDGDGLLDLMDVPGFNPLATGTLDFRGKGIQDLDGVNLLTRASRLDLSDNQITRIETGTFYQLPNLQLLNLSNNPIDGLGTGAFQGLPRLESLELRGNQLTQLGSGVFEGLTNLKELRLDGQPISRIQSRAFERFVVPETLVMHGGWGGDCRWGCGFQPLDIPVLNLTGIVFRPIANDGVTGFGCEWSEMSQIIHSGWCPFTDTDRLILDDATLKAGVV